MVKSEYPELSEIPTKIGEEMKIDSAKPGEFYLVGTANGPQLFKVLELGYYPGARAGILFDGAKVRSTRVAFKKWWVK